MMNNKKATLSLILSFFSSTYLYSCNNLGTPQPTNTSASSKPEITNSEMAKPYSRGKKVFNAQSTDSTPTPQPSESPSVLPSPEATPSTESSPTSETSPMPSSSVSPSTSSSPTPSPSSSVGLIGNTTDISSLATLNGKVTDASNIPVEDAKVSARSIDPNVNWVGDEQVTIGGTYVFRNVPVGVRIEITVKKDSLTKTKIEVLKSNLNGIPSANEYNFTNFSELKLITLAGNLYDDKDVLLKTEAEVTIKSTDSSNPWEYVSKTSTGIFSYNVPLNVPLKITVKAGDKTKTRELTFSQNSTVNFGGTVESDKTFAIAQAKEEIALGVNLFVDTEAETTSTFSTEVDTSAYDIMKNTVMLADALPNKKLVRIEDYVNYFDYNYTKPIKEVFSINTELANAPFGNGKKLLRIGIQGKDLKVTNKKNSVLTFLIDTSGSMGEKGKLETIKNSLKALLKQLNKTDKVSIITYNNSAKVLVDNLGLDQETKILTAIDSLNAGSNTNIELGIKEAFKTAKKNFIKNSINRIVLCSDGVSNAGEIEPQKLLDLVKEESSSEINLSTIGIGFENYNDEFLENLATNGMGFYVYTNNEKEASKALFENASDVLQAIAKDASIQVTFDKKVVKQFRLIGYEKKEINTLGFRKDTAGKEIEPNYTITALYELDLQETTEGEKVADVMFKFKTVDQKNTPVEISKEILLKDLTTDSKITSYSYRLASVVALYGEIIRGSYWKNTNKLQDVLTTLLLTIKAINY
jgi:Ca-activated chloride channel family protein